jgi:hydroxypyruvate reductase
LKSDLAQTSPLAPEPLNLIIADGRGAAEASLIRAAQLGFMSRLVTARLKGEAREVALVVSAMAKDAPALHCLILAGETTVTLRGSGQGGRNQEVALAAAIELDGWPGIAIGCFATDGEDGNSDAAGACINGTTAGAARLAAMDPRAYLDENDSYRFFENLENQALSDGEQLLDSMPGGLIKTGPTGTNVNDLLFVLTYPHENGNETAPKRIDGRPLRYS